MKKFFAVSILALGLAAGAPFVAPALADQYGGFQQFADAGSIKPFARDLGGILGSATFHSGRSLGFSGFDAGIRGGMQFRPDANDRILRNNAVHVFGLPWVQAEVGMPFKIDGFIRGISYQGLTIAGGGLRYGLLKTSDKPWAPQVLISGVGHSVVHQFFSASHFGASLVASMGVPSFTPYIGAGFDRTRVVVRSSTVDPSLDGTTVQTLESRFTAGMSLRPWPFFYVNLAAILVHGLPGAEGGLGLHF
ncbi:MAG: hypothetical protein KGO96_02345 [Elusimicrobia bacterium]|nr:hypothetical protein [Elusimicrobiota bacterium]MDE2237127.1 hypothetical protein [Elusimicrobiota bacterium]MDE2424737.1 hypothetical protein [Elusimicrobiota bacterium]